MHCSNNQLQHFFYSSRVIANCCGVLVYQSLCGCIPEAIEALPLSNTPEVLGLHANAEIGYYMQAVRDMWVHLLELQPQTGACPV